MNPSRPAPSPSSETSTTLDPPPSSSTTTSTHRPLLTATTSTSQAYIESCARSNQLASLNDPMTLLFQAEKLPSLPNEPPIPPNTPPTSPTVCAILWARLQALPPAQISEMVYTASLGRLNAKCKPDATGTEPGTGAFIAEAGNFAAVTCWEPMYAPPPPVDWEAKYGPEFPNIDLSDMLGMFTSNGTPMSQVMRERPIFADFWMKMERAKYRFLYPVVWRYALAKVKVNAVFTTPSTPPNPDSDITLSPIPTNSNIEIDKSHLKYFYICLTSRNPSHPSSPPTPGAVRAIIQPFLRRFTEEEDIPAVWIAASNERARDVYSWFGFRVVEEIVIGVDQVGRGVRTWLMMYTKEGAEK